VSHHLHTINIFILFLSGSSLIALLDSFLLFKILKLPLVLIMKLKKFIFLIENIHNKKIKHIAIIHIRLGTNEEFFLILFVLNHMYLFFILKI
jgi:hypothetical protein